MLHTLCSFIWSWCSGCRKEPQRWKILDFEGQLWKGNPPWTCMLGTNQMRAFLWSPRFLWSCIIPRELIHAGNSGFLEHLFAFSHVLLQCLTPYSTPIVAPGRCSFWTRWRMLILVFVLQYMRWNMKLYLVVSFFLQSKTVLMINTKIQALYSACSLTHTGISGYT